MYQTFTKKQGIPFRYIHQFLLIMRLTTVILIAAIMQVSASSFAQKITLSEKNSALSKVLKEIRIQSGYDFVFTTATFLYLLQQP
ncbi:hypothetical protein HDC92_004984 [Pedobacter sp. AK017]|nr:hypothetical protein [Pedobacter sp. AK017]